MVIKKKEKWDIDYIISVYNIDYFYIISIYLSHKFNMKMNEILHNKLRW